MSGIPMPALVVKKEKPDIKNNHVLSVSKEIDYFTV